MVHKLILAATLGLAASQPDPSECSVCLGKPAIMARQGVVSHGGFDFAHSNTHGVEGIFDDELPIYWIEGEHIKLGFAAVEFSADSNGQQSSLATGALALQPYARAHSFLKRAEETYQLVQNLLRVEAADFPQLDASGEPVAASGQDAKYMGEGPHLGQPGKFEILILPGPVELQKYLKSSYGLNGAYLSHTHLRHSGALTIVMDLRGGDLWDDLSVWGHMTHFVTHMLLAGYKFDAYLAPQWLEVGLAHALERDINHIYNNFCGNPEVAPKGHLLNDWSSQVKKHLRSNKGPYLERLLERQSTYEFTLDDHLVAWSMVRFLLDEHSAAFAGINADIHGITKGKWDAGAKQLRSAHKSAFARHLDMTYAEFDKAWKRWARKQEPQARSL